MACAHSFAVFASSDGALSVARLSNGAVVLASHSRSVVVLDEPGALAIDVLLDRPVPLAISDDLVREARSILPLLWSGLLASDAGTSTLRARRIESLRRHAEPASWREAPRARRSGPAVRGLVQIADGVTRLFFGANEAVLARAASELGSPARPDARAERLTLRRADGGVCAEREDGRPVLVDELWLVTRAPAELTRIVTLAAPEALGSIVLHVDERPTLAALETLAIAATSAVTRSIALME